MSRPTGLSGTVWAIHPKPLDDEVLSSWMVRLARAYGIKPVWFWRLFWLVDFRKVDVHAPGGLLDLLATKTGTPFERVLETILTGIVLKKYRVVRKRRYCPACLAADAEPYFRRRWQIHSFLLCDIHGVPLSTGCQRWGHDLMPELVPLSQASMAWCLQCGEDLRTEAGVAMTPFEPCRPADQVMDWERRLWSIIRPEAGHRPKARRRRI